MTNNVWKVNNCINIALSQTSGSCLHNQYAPGMFPKLRISERVTTQLVKTSNRLTFLKKCKVHDIVLKGLTLKASYHSHRSSKITLQASKALLRDRTQFYCFKKATLSKQINDLETFFHMSINQSDQLCNLSAVEGSFKHHFLNQKKFQIQKFSAQKISIHLSQPRRRSR
jgi:hypothetical protein